MPSSLSGELPLTLFTAFLTLVLNVYLSLPQRLLAGLRAYTLAPPEAGDELARSSVGVFRITTRALPGRPLYRAFASVVSTCVLAACTAAVGELLGARATVVPALALLSAGHAVRALLSSQADRALSPEGEARLGGVAALGGGMLALLLLMSSRRSDTFALDDASRALAPVLARLKGESGGGGGGGGGWAGYASLAAPASLLAGALSGLLCAPGVRWAKCFTLRSQPPAFFRDSAEALQLPSAAATAFSVALARAAFCATMLCAALPPLQSVLRRELRQAGLPAWMDRPNAPHHAWLLLLSAALHMLALRPLMQSFLDGALNAWHELCHSGQGGLAACGGNVADVKAATKLLRAVMDVKFESTSRLVCKAALQFAALPALQLAGGLLMLARREGTEAEGEVLVPPELVRSLAGLLACWASCSWVFAAGAMLTALRTGLLRV